MAAIGDLGQADGRHSEPRITVSIGIRAFRANDPHFETAPERADDALCEAKRAGRVRACWVNRASGFPPCEAGGYPVS